MSAAPTIPNTPEARRAGAILTIDLDALQSNWRALAAQAPNVETAAVVKAQAYGLAVGKAAPALHAAGCKTFFVASIDEAIELRHILGKGPTIHVFNGFMDGAEREFIEFDLIPVLNSLGDMDAWQAFCAGYGHAVPCDIHVDTGMSRLGLPPYEVQKIADNPDHLMHLKVETVLSHLVAAEEADHPKSPEQLAAFKAAMAHFPGARASLANSSGIFLGADYHFDLTRPGTSLYGVNPTPDQANPMAQVVRLQGKILQVRAIDTPQSVGYGATYTAQGAERIATISVGYADGYLRSLSNAGVAYVGDHPAPVVGRVSMDLIGLDVSAVPEDLCHPGMLVDLIGPHNPVDDVADRAGTIGYEILTSLGARYHRVYVGGEI